jgi:hypothetical protein
MVSKILFWLYLVNAILLINHEIDSAFWKEWDDEIIIQTAAATAIFFEYLNDKSKIVVTFAMQALADLAIKEPDITARVTRAIEKLTQTGSPAIRSRGKKLLPQLKNPSDKNRRAKTVEK